jgi:hypothetical protein
MHNVVNNKKLPNWETITHYSVRIALAKLLLVIYWMRESVVGLEVPYYLAK